MTDMTPMGEEPDPQRMLEIALQTFERAITALNDRVQALEQGELVEPKELKRLTADAGQAFRTAFDERKKLEEYRKKEAGELRAHELDFEAARNEIGRRLARLRTTGDPGAVSG